MREIFKTLKSIGKSEYPFGDLRGHVIKKEIDDFNRRLKLLDCITDDGNVKGDYDEERYVSRAISSLQEVSNSNQYSVNRLDCTQTGMVFI